MSYAFMLYTLKVGGCLAAFYLFFKLFLSRETFHTLNRVVVLSALVVASLLPFCVVTIRKEVALPLMTVGELTTIPTEVISQEAAFPWETLLSALFVLGGVVMLVRVVWSMVMLRRLVARAPKRELGGGVTLVHADHPQAPFSWFGYVVVGERDLEENGDAILAHETAHIRLRHSWDLVLFDLVGVVQWFNPALWLLRRDLKAIHEYEADRAVLRSGVNAREYQLLLIKKAAGERWYSVANSFNHSNLKNRITMMIQKRSSRWAAAKVLLLLPLIGIALGAFAETRYVYSEDKDSAKNQLSQTAEQGMLHLRVFDDAGKPVVGAVVVKVGTGEGVCTDQEGRATIAVQVGDKLSCSYIGKRTEQYEVKTTPTEETALTLILATESQQVDEIVVKGYDAPAPKQTAKTEEAVPFMLVDDERKKEILEQSKTELATAKADLETAKAELETVKAEMEQPNASAEEEVFLIVESMPKFEGGGINAFRQWVMMRVQYPDALRKSGVQGPVVVSFVVGTDGSVGKIEVLRSPHQALSDEVVRVVKSSPRWTPGTQRGQKVDVKYTLPVTFKVDTPQAETITPNGVTPAVADFAGGDYRRFTQWAQNQLSKDDTAHAGEELFVTFIVKANGAVGDVDVIGRADKQLAKEAVRVVKSSPKWTPAKNRDGKAVAAKYGIKLRFEEA
ncbi:MAG: TonB family protein [Alistipes sp.]|nr:TonB family protein [Alistipes sp.]